MQRWFSPGSQQASAWLTMARKFDSRSGDTHRLSGHTCLLISDIPVIAIAYEEIVAGFDEPCDYVSVSTWSDARLTLMRQSFDLVFVCCRGNFSRELAALNRAFRNNNWLTMPLSGNSGLVGITREHRNVRLISFSASSSQLSDAIREMLVKGTAARAPIIEGIDPPVTTLTAQEHNILELLSDGLSTKQIANKLNYAAGTVRNCLSKTYRKLGVTDRTSAALVFSRLYQQSETAPKSRPG